MATLSDLIVKLSLDSSKFSQGLSETVQSLSKLQTKFRDSKTGIVDFGKVTESLKNNAQLLTEKFKLQSARLENLKQKYQEACDAEGEDSETAQRLAVQIGTLERNMQTLQGRIDAVNSDIETNSNRLYQVGTNMQGVGDKLRQLGSKVSDVGKTLTTHLTVPLVGVGTAAVKVTADFDSAMSEVAAISGATGDELDQLRDKALEMGSKTQFSATESAEAMKYMAMAGWDTQQMMDGLAGVMNAAAASGEDLGTVSDILTDGLTAFGMAASESGRMADVLTAAATSSNTTIGLLGETFKYTAPVCGALKISLEDCALATGLMANAGIKGSQAGTTLRTGLTNLINPSSSVAKAMEQYGVALQTNADGSANLSATMQVLRDKLGGLSETERAAALAAIFGSDAVSGWSAVVTASDDDFNSLADAIANSTGKAEEIANLKLDNLSGQLTILKSTVEGIAVQIGDILTPTVSGIVDKLQSCATAFSGLDDSTKKTIVTIAGVAAAVGPVIAVIGIVISTIGGMVSAVGGVVAAVGAGTGVLAALGGAFTAFAGPIAIVVAAVAAAAIAIVTHWDDIKQKAGEIKDSVAGKIGELATVVSEKFGDMGDAAGRVKDAISEKLSAIGDTVQGALDTVAGIVQVGLMVISEVMSAGAQIITLPWQFLWQNFGAPIAEYLAPAAEAVKTKMTEIEDAISGKLTEAASVASGKWSEISTTVSTKAGEVKAAISGKLSEATSVASGKWSSMSSTASQYAGSIYTAASTRFGQVQSAVSSKLSAAATTASTKFNSIKTSAATALSSMASTVSSKLSSVASYFSTKMQAAKDAVSNAVSKIKDAFNFTWSLPKIKLPHFSITGSFSLNPPSVPKFSVTWYKNGAVFAKPTLFDTASGVKGVGEAGAEAVLPLSTLWRELDDRLAAALARFSSNGNGIANSELTQLLVAIKDAVSAGFAEVVSCLKVERTDGGQIVLKLIIDGKELAAVLTPYVDENLDHRRNLAGRYV